jgi:hypothetical protein
VCRADIAPNLALSSLARAVFVLAQPKDVNVTAMPPGGMSQRSVLTSVRTMRPCYQPLARPEGVTYEKQEGEEIIKLPQRPPVVVMGSWGAAFVARELARMFAPETLSISGLVPFS